tara:strand:- start:14 stop:634 length:621 start_codon:yes stop_codon:yes gene_type:complete
MKNRKKIIDLPHYPSTLRNRDPILKVIETFLPPRGSIIETASATGEHIAYFANKLPNLFWQPSDKNEKLFWAIEERSKELKNVYKPFIIDLTEPEKTKINMSYEALFNINMVHISSWRASIGLFEFAKNYVKDNGFVFMYGPFKEKAMHTSMSNDLFDSKLRLQNSLWGVRSLEKIETLAKDNGFLLKKKFEMPSNNLSLIFIKKY